MSTPRTTAYGDQQPEAPDGELRTRRTAPGDAQDGPTAFDSKTAHARLDGFTDDELKQITLVPEGSQLEQGATYLDLLDPTGGEIVGTTDLVADDAHLYVAKRAVDFGLWNRLRGVDDPDRLNQPNAPDQGEGTG
ncbi:MAG: hypothetical protein AVDCRST_MAG49-3288 [uncultured Thermomicrobiales bacterium]|uniref:Uncharacterized protein n=1 Tax=uncultured Thermomicrobiales bacterium TaxID=1645740 RepID=A0A6J4V4B0_9BACT|nr:MAG: hypothetical protein AVDCRST_MAG49-3288 [uncultured Thermomicrobiales bacterium]